MRSIILNCERKMNQRREDIRMEKMIFGTIFWKKEGKNFEKRYQILCEAIHTITKEPLVIYQALYENFCILAMPKEEFLAKFEEATMEETIEKESKEQKNSIQQTDSAKTSKSEEMDSDLAAFLDASDPAEKLECLYNMKKHLNEYLMSSIEISMDLPVGTDSLEERLDYVKRHLQMVARFESNRLRQ